MSRLGDTIRLFRRRAGMTQAHMARELRISPSAYSALERGKTAISMARLRKIASLLGTIPADILHAAELPTAETGTGSYSRNGKELERLSRQAAIQEQMIRNNREIIDLLRKFRR